MAEKPDEQLLREKLTARLDENRALLQDALNGNLSADVVQRPLTSGGVRLCLVFLDGMAGRGDIDRFILEPCQRRVSPLPEGEARADELTESVLCVDDAEKIALLGEAVEAILDGKSVMLIDGCPCALALETRAYEKRGVGRTNSESVVQGPQEAFVENLKTNVSIMRRLVRSEMLIGESLKVGTKLPTQATLMYLRGVARGETVDLIRRRIQSLTATRCPGTGYLQQLIEDHPGSLFPQMLQTERPDRVAAALADGQIALFVDGSPYALIAPITLFHLMNASDDTFMRWQYGTFVRVIRLMGALMSLLLPGIYVAVTLFHVHFIPLNRLTSIAETRARVPFSVLVEVVFMELSFYLINEAGTRIPSQLGSALGIVGALILGQAAVEASIISPILIIVISLTGLGGYAIPSYGLSVGVQIARMAFVVLGGLLGIYGLVLGVALMTGYLSQMESFGEKYLAPLAPHYPHNGDIVVRLPLFMQTRTLFTVARDSWLQRTRRAQRPWRKRA